MTSIKSLTSTFALVFISILMACTTATVSNPPRTATEQLLISSAADKAAAQLIFQLPPDSKIFVDNSNFEGTDSKYAVGSIRTGLLKQGFKLVDAKKDADIAIDIRSGALSIDNESFLIGIPSFNVPVPFASSSLALPEIALYKSADQKGVAKFAATAYDAKSGLLIRSDDPEYGFSHNKEHTVMIVVSWKKNDALPDEDELSWTHSNEAQSSLTASKP